MESKSSKSNFSCWLTLQESTSITCDFLLDKSNLEKFGIPLQELNSSVELVEKKLCDFLEGKWLRIKFSTSSTFKVIENLEIYPPPQEIGIQKNNTTRELHETFGRIREFNAVSLNEEDCVKCNMAQKQSLCYNCRAKNDIPFSFSCYFTFKEDYGVSNYEMVMKKIEKFNLKIDYRCAEQDIKQILDHFFREIIQYSK